MRYATCADKSWTVLPLSHCGASVVLFLNIDNWNALLAYCNNDKDGMLISYQDAYMEVVLAAASVPKFASIATPPWIDCTTTLNIARDSWMTTTRCADYL